MILLEQLRIARASGTAVLFARLGSMLRKGLTLLAISLTVSLAVAHAQEPKSSTDPVFHLQQRVKRVKRATQQLSLSRRLIGPGPGTNVPTPLGPDSVVSATSLAAPKKAKFAFTKAMRELDKGPSASLDKARQHLENAVAEYPEYAAAWTKLGQVKADTGDPDGAIVALEKSVSLDERFLLPYDALVWLYMAKEDWDHATELTQFVLGINPAYTKMRWYRAGCAYESGRDDEALALFGEIRDDSEAVNQFPQTHLLMGLIHAQRGQLGDAAAAYKSYLELDPNVRDAEAIKKQLSEWEQIGVL